MLLLRRFLPSGLHLHSQTLTLTLTRPKPAIFAPIQSRPNLRRYRPRALRHMAGHPTPPAASPAEKSEVLRALETSLGSPLSAEPLRPHPGPLVVVVSGPSGVGKDAVIRRLRELRDGLHFVVTATTRPMRPGEVHGRDYFFVTEEEFAGMVERDELLEHAVVYGDRKGIPRQQIRDFMARGCDVVLRVDVQGAETLRRVLGDAAVFVFVVAASEAEMAGRLAGRGTESPEALAVRVAAAREEVKRLRDFDYVVVNKEGELEAAARLVGSIVDAEKAKVRQRNVVV